MSSKYITVTTVKVVLTGLSGKSSLAFDTIYAEGQRHYVRVAFKLCPYVPRADGSRMSITLTAFRRPFPSTENNLKNPRSTVGTVTEIYDYLRLCTRAHRCAHCGLRQRIRQQTVDQIVDRVMGMRSARKIQVLARWCAAGRARAKKEFEAARKGGFVRVRADGIIYDLSKSIKLRKNKTQH